MDDVLYGLDECPSCGVMMVAGISDQTCERCLEEGCMECMPNGVCSVCNGDEGHDHARCLACLNNWSHG